MIPGTKVPQKNSSASREALLSLDSMVSASKYGGTFVPDFFGTLSDFHLLFTYR